jgi:diguanylate cyclase (GGDEF)-like protein
MTLPSPAEVAPASQPIPFWGSFRFRILSLLVATQVLFVVGAGIYGIHHSTSTEVQKTFVANQASLKVAAAIVDNQICAYGDTLNVLAVTEALGSFDRVAAGQLLKNYKVSALFIANERVVLYDHQNAFVTDNSMVGESSREGFQQFGEVKLGRVFQGPTHWEHLAPSRTFAVTVQNLARANGVLAADFSFRRLAPLLSDFRVGVDGYVVLIDQDGSILYHPDARWTTKPRSIRQLLGTASFDVTHFGTSEPTFFRRADGQRIMVNYLWNPEARVGVLAIQPAAEIEAAARQVHQTLILMLLVMLLVMSLVSGWLSTVLARPLLVLAEKMTQIKRGDWEVESGLRGHDEIGRLAEIFDSMRESIRSSMQQLAAHRDRLEAEVAARTQELAKANQVLRQLSRTDELTGLSNRRDIIEKIRYESYRARRNGRVFAFLMVDIDHFKSVNDTHGHECGDSVLRAVSDAIRQTLRRHEYLARWGGEEFLVVLPETDSDGARIAGERIRARVEGMEFVHAGQALKVTLTVGASIFDGRLGVARSLVLADKALYRGKQAGRNRVELWDPSDTPASDYQAAARERELFGDSALDLLRSGSDWPVVPEPDGT